MGGSGGRWSCRGGGGGTFAPPLLLLLLLLFWFGSSPSWPREEAYKEW
jgi:hypothetical protein